MEAALFQLYKVQRAISTQGTLFTVENSSKNEYNEPTDMVQTTQFKGLYHEYQETTGFIAKTTSDSSTVNRKSSPMILCILDEVKGLSKGDHIIANRKTYELVEIKDIAEAGIIADLSLEEIQGG